VSTNWSRHGVGKRFESADLKAVDKKQFEAVFQYAKHYDAMLKEGRGLLLSGPPGIGKTYAITALMKKLRESRDSRFDFQFVTAPLLFDRVSNREQDAFRGKSWLDVYTSVQGLVINDLGKEDRSREWKNDEIIGKLGRVLRARHEDQLPVFITTNLPLVAPKHNKALATFSSVYGESLWSLIYDMTELRAQCHGDDRRKPHVELTKDDDE
jgi:DNA replication protein DnaC